MWFCDSLTGAYGDYCLCAEMNIGVLPENVSFEDGVMLGIPHLTA